VGRYVWGPASDEPLVWYDGSGTGNKRYLVADERGSIIAVTDNSGAAIAINTYDESGIPGAANLGMFQYTGQAWLPELGMYHFKARTYSPTLGRFMQTDPIGYGDGIGWYNYGHGDPINNTDPTGLQTGTNITADIHCPSCFGTGMATFTTNKEPREKGDRATNPNGLSGTYLDHVKYDLQDREISRTAILFFPDLFSNQDQGGFSGGYGGGASGQSGDITVTGFRRAAYQPYLQNPYAWYMPIDPIIGHIAKYHFIPRKGKSLFRPEWRSLKGQEQLYQFLIAHAVPQPSLLIPGTYTLSATFPLPVGWERNTGRLTYNVSAAVWPAGKNSDGRTIYVPHTQYPGMP
jgi:RHS repeat-associated protein